MHLHHHPEPFTNVSLFELAPMLNSPTSTCTSHSSSPDSSSSSCSESSPGPSSDEAPSPLHSEPQMESPARAQPAETPVRRPRPRRPSSAPVPVVESPPTKTGPDAVGRRAPKQRRVTRAVQPLACFFCRGRKIACGPPVKIGTGDRTCEYVAIRPYNSVSLFLQNMRARWARDQRGFFLAPLFVSIFGSLCVFSGADCSRFLYWLDPVHGAVSFVNILQSHIVAAVPQGQKRPPGNCSGVELLKRLAGPGNVLYTLCSAVF